MFQRWAISGCYTWLFPSTTIPLFVVQRGILNRSCVIHWWTSLKLVSGWLGRKYFWCFQPTFLSVRGIFFQSLCVQHTNLEIIFTICMLGKDFSRRHFEIFFVFILENRIWHLVQIVCMKCQILFSRQNKKNIISLSSAEFAHGVIRSMQGTGFA